MSSVTFYIKGDAPSAIANGAPKRELRRGKTYIIKDHYLVMDTREGKQGSTYIRYLPGETSIYVDEQRAKFDLDTLRSSTAPSNKITILERKIKVDTVRNPLLYKYLQAVPLNVENAESNSWNGTCIYEYRPNERAKNADDHFNHDTDLRIEIRQLDLLSLKAAYRILGAKTIRQMEEMDAHTIQHQLYLILTQSRNRDEVQNQYKLILEDKLLAIKYDLYEAIDKGIIVQNPVDPRTFVMAKTRVSIKTAPDGSNPINWFAEWLAYKGVDTLMMIRGYLGRKPKETPDGIEARHVSDGEKVDQILDHIFSEENQLTKMSGKHHMYSSKSGEDFSLGLGRESIKKKLFESRELRYEVYERLKALKELQDA